jgi:hypothetical protein
MSRLHRDIAALADGSRENPGLRERVAASPELTALLAEQERAVSLTAKAKPTAPASLRAAVANPAAARRPTAAPRARGPLLGFAAAAAGVIALGVVALLPGTQAPSVAAVARVAAVGPAKAAPAQDPAHPDLLTSAVDGVHYPYWADAFGWRTSGSRSDRTGGRPTTTVYYTDAQRMTVDYTIVGGAPLAEPAAGRVQQMDGTRFVGLTAAGRTIVTWRRDGHTCVVSATGVPLPTLLRLAEWRYDATA